MSIFTKTIDGIIADITTKIEHLHVVAEAHAEAEKVHNAIIAERALLASRARAEYTRAKAIAERFAALVK